MLTTPSSQFDPETTVMQKLAFPRWIGRFAVGYLVSLGAYAAGPPVQAVDSVAMTVGNMDASRAFYETVLNFEFVSETEVSGETYERLYGVFGLRLHIVTLKLGDEKLQLEQFIAPQGRPFPVDSRSNDRWFQHVAIIVSDMDRAFAWLREHKVIFASSGPQELPQSNKQAAGISAFYFRDPDGHYLEVLHFPEDKGSPKWHVRPGRLFLGIDHTAIVVADTDTSLKFYRNTLGLAIVGTSENYGTEQEHLNNVFGARLRITTLHAASGPGVELLEYLTPRDGRAMPAETRANDVWHWQINFTADVDAVEHETRANHYRMISPGIVADDARKTIGIMISDPDGHASLLESTPHR
jgi:catechol 2,3-dioxygenase-like lactoylglutathione lyase family enzyme